MFIAGRWHSNRRRCDRDRRNQDPYDLGRVEDLIAFVEWQLGFTGRQKEAWGALRETLRDSADAIQTARAAVEQEEPRALSRFARYEDVATILTVALRRIRPRLEALYRTLDARQRWTFDQLMSREAAHWAPPATLCIAAAGEANPIA